MNNKSCTCGSAATNSPAHSSWCDSLKPVNVIIDHETTIEPRKGYTEVGVKITDPVPLHLVHYGLAPNNNFEIIKVDADGCVTLSDASIEKLTNKIIETACKTGLPQIKCFACNGSGNSGMLSSAPVVVCSRRAGKSWYV